MDPATHKVLLAINQHLGNWSPKDAINFHGRGPIQLTGRYNFQLFANYVGNQTIMTQPQLLSDAGPPTPGPESAAWFWEVESKHRLNEVTNANAGQTSEVFDKQVTVVINPGLKGLPDRSLDI